MSKREHTPGEWTIADDDGVQVPFIPVYAGSIGDPTYKDVCEVACSLDDDDEFVISKHDRANARVIAASPDMLEALILAKPYVYDALSALVTGQAFSLSLSRRQVEMLQVVVEKTWKQFFQSPGSAGVVQLRCLQDRGLVQPPSDSKSTDWEATEEGVLVYQLCTNAGLYDKEASHDK